MATSVTAVIVSWNTRALLERCLDTLARVSAGVVDEVIVVDNASTDGSARMVRARHPAVRVIESAANEGFARANNRGVAAARGEYVLLLNSDAFPAEGALRAMASLLDLLPEVGLVGAQLRNADGSFQASHTPFPSLWSEFLILTSLGRALHGPWYPSRGPNERQPRAVDYVEGACMLVRRRAYLSVGGFDEGYFMYAEDVDLCRALRRAGWEVWYHPEAVVTHLGGASSSARRPEREADLYRSRVRYRRKHHGALAAETLKAMILATSAAKMVLHGGLRLLSGGRRGRAVPSPRYLSARLKGV